ncbi:hypothetical protein AVEN_26285-1 [Araneus ventricosus]|uniref:Uncharacterized protein n=1 Tax=Araneus ventricosus TaxID=182803 RepID=A0A4Y2APD1_ARAVE|nr:hypothetical protein AVEN_26285-1 [Araneus ventricosus]
MHESALPPLRSPHPTPSLAGMTPTHYPPPPHGEFPHFRESTFPFSDFSSLTTTPTNSLPPQRSPHMHWRFIARLEESYFIFMDIHFDGEPISPSVYTNFHRDFTLTIGFGILCSKKCEVEHR